MLSDYGKNSNNSNEREMLINLAFQFVESQNSGIEINKTKFEILTTTDYFGDLNEHISKLTNKKYKKNDVSMSDLDLAKEALDDEDSKIPANILTKLTTCGLSYSASENKISNTRTTTTTSKPQKKSTPLIEEVFEDSNCASLPKYEENICQVEQTLNDQVAVYNLKVYLPTLSSVNDCQLDINDNSLTLNTKNKMYKQLDISLVDLRSKYSFSNEDIQAKFVKKTAILKVKINLSIKNKI